MKTTTENVLVISAGAILLLICVSIITIPIHYLDAARLDYTRLGYERGVSEGMFLQDHVGQPGFASASAVSGQAETNFLNSITLP